MLIGTEVILQMIKISVLIQPYVYEFLHEGLTFISWVFYKSHVIPDNRHCCNVHIKPPLG